MRSVFLYIVVVVLVVLTGLYLLGRQESVEGLTFGARESQDATHFIDRDSDGDGLADWEEGLWNTDPENPDSDGDGTRDGAEVEANRNPRIPPPDEKLPDLIEERETQESGVDLVSETVLSNYISLKTEGDEGATARETDLNSLVENVVIEPPATLEITDLAIVEDNEANIAAFQAELAVIRSRYVYPELGTELAILFETLDSGSLKEKEGSAFIELSKAREAYAHIASELRETQVPVPEAAEHLVRTNAFIGLEAATGHLINSIGDVVRALPSVQLYVLAVDQLD